ncbi:hypothetical protein GQ53DRAFT_663276 [Thozetella sp. PMI_491]|nr:hypothetical protein GQ53DRAFT_663276 [Thozetella sp. PMI_491]
MVVVGIKGVGRRRVGALAFKGGRLRGGVGWHAGRDCAKEPIQPLYLDEISEDVEGIAGSLWPINKRIYDNPELGYEEFVAHAALASFMKAQKGWETTPSAYGMATAWVSVYDTDKRGPVVSFNVEMDALPGIGHACGHNLIASASVAAGLATAKVMKRHSIGGKVVLFGTLAEEGGGGKIKLLERGAYKDHGVDINLISHPGIGESHAFSRTTAYARFKVEYFGREAHAAAAPWLGINALDGLINAYNSLSALRQQTMPSDIIQGYITDGGVAPNIIHAYAAGVFVARASTQARLTELRKKVEACFVAGALSSGAELKITPIGAYADHLPNRALGASFVRYINSLNPPGMYPEDPDIDEIGGATMASSDQGDISYAMPTLSPNFSVPPGPKGNGPHNPDFAEASGTWVAFERCLRVGKALAGTAVDVLTEDGLLEAAKKEWKRAVHFGQ